MITRQKSSPIVRKEMLIIPSLVLVGLLLILTGGYFLLRSIGREPVKVTGVDAAHFTQVTFSPAYRLPYLLTNDGELLIPVEEEGVWIAEKIDNGVQVHSMMVDANRDIWLATDHGLHHHHDNAWSVIDPTPVKNLLPVEADFIKIGVDDKPLGLLSGSRIDIPLEEDMVLENIVALGDQSHVALSDGAVYFTTEMDIWEPMDMPGDVRRIWDDGVGHVLIETSEGIFRWWWETDTMEQISTDLPGNAQGISDLVMFNEQVFALAEGQMLRYEDERWQSVSLAETAQITQLKAHGTTLWALDEQSMSLWLTEDGSSWNNMPIRIQSVS